MGGVEPPKPPKEKSKEQLCLEAGGVFNDQFQVCEFPEKPPNGPGTDGCPPLGELLSIGTRVKIANISKCGVSRGKSGVVTGTTFQRERDRVCNDISMIVRLDDGTGNAFRRSETAPAGDCMARETVLVGCGPQPPTPPGTGFYYVLNNAVRWVETSGEILAGGIVIFGAGFDATFKAWLQCRVKAFPPLGDL